MLVDQVLLRLIEAHYISIILAGCILYFIRNKYGHGLDSIPGPFLASFTDWWRYVDVKRGSAHLTHVGLFRRYKGDLVRIGPKCVTTTNMNAIRQIYGTKLIYSKVMAITQSSTMRYFTKYIMLLSSLPFIQCK